MKKRIGTPKHCLIEALGLLCLSLILMTSSARAQVDQGAVTGEVTDNTGAVVPKAQVTLTDVDTGLALRARRTKAGSTPSRR